MNIFTLPLLKVVDETKTIRSFFFEKKEFLAGQFCKVTLGNEHRFFSFASSPTEKEMFFSVKNSESSFNNALWKLPLGEKITITMPMGKLLLPEKESEIVFLAGGIGIAPFRSMLRFLSDSKSTKTVMLFYSNKTKADIAFFKDLEAIATHNKSFHFYYTLTKGSSSKKFLPGRITQTMLKKYIPDVANKKFYICGGMSFVKDSIEILRNVNVESTNMVFELFTGID